MPRDLSPAPGARRRWRFYATAAGNKPVLDFLRWLAVRARGGRGSDRRGDGARPAGRNPRGAQALGRIYEVRIDGDRAIYRVLFSVEGERVRILLALEAFSEKTQKTPPQLIDLAERRLADWRRRG